MNQLRKDVRDLITVTEKLQSALAQGDRFTEDETAIVRMCAGELLENLHRSSSEHNGGNGETDWSSRATIDGARRQDGGPELGLSQMDQSAARRYNERHE